MTLGPAPQGFGGRIVLALDDTLASEILLTVGCRLAAGTGARLIGLYVQDNVLLQLAGSGLGREVGSFSGAERVLEHRDLERSMELRAGAIHQRLAEEAARVGVRWSFRLARGRVDRELLTVSGTGDLLILGRGASRRRLGSVVRRLVDEGRGPILVLGAEFVPAGADGRLLLVHQGVEDGEATVVAAASLAEGLGRRLEVFLPGGQQALEERVRTLLEDRRSSFELHPLARLDVDTLFAEAAPGSADLLVVPSGGPLGDRLARRAILERARGPVLLLG